MLFSAKRSANSDLQTNCKPSPSPIVPAGISQGESSAPFRASNFRPVPGPTIGGNAFLGDVGFAGPDGGKGGKFLILPPGYDKPLPHGYFVFRSGTNNVFVFLRSFYQDPNNLAPAVQLMEQAKIYPLGARPAQCRCSTPMLQACRRTCCRRGMSARSISSKCWSTAKARTLPTLIGLGCSRRSAS